MKLPGFPVPQRGETVASVVARYLARNAAPKTRLLQILGLYLASPNSVVPQDLGQLTSVMPAGHPWEGALEPVVKGHTLVPLFLHFAHPERSAAVMKTIISGSSGNPSASLGILAAGTKETLHTVRFCPECIVHDLRTFGFPILYRQHQPRFVIMCAVHARILHFNCVCAQGSKNSTRRWQMAGHCECREPHTPAVLEGNLDARTEENWLWLSRQVSTILGKPDFAPKTHIAANLLALLRRGGFASKKKYGLDPDEVTKSLLSHFTEAFLRQLGLGTWHETTRLSPARLLHRSVIEGTRTPSVLRMLLLARLVTDEISSLWNSEKSDSAQQEDRLPPGYPRNVKMNRERIDKEAIQLALDDAKGKLTIAAKHLGVTLSMLVTDLRHHRIRVPLSSVASKRLGGPCITAVREALVQGVSITKIQRLYKITLLSICLIELDRPELYDIHRQASVNRLREKHRDALLSFLRNGPGESRRQFAKRFAAAYKWLGRYDRRWLSSHLPESRQGWPGRRKFKARKNWKLLDESAFLAVRQSANKELQKPDRPTRLTPSRLLSTIGGSAALSQHRRLHYPLAIAEAERLSETKEQFVRRSINWALRKIAGQSLAISLNRLQKLASTSHKELKRHRKYIIEIAAELGITFDARSLLAPSNKDQEAL